MSKLHASGRTLLWFFNIGMFVMILGLGANSAWAQADPIREPGCCRTTVEGDGFCCPLCSCTVPDCQSNEFCPDAE